MSRALSFPLLLLSCASAAPAPPSAGVSEGAGADVVYALDLSAPDHVSVELRATADAARQGLRVPLEWEGRGGMDRAIRVIDVRDGRGRELAHTISRWTLRAPGAAGGLTVRYQVATRGGLDADSEGYPIRAGEYFLSTGHPLLMVPEVWVESGEGRYRVEIAAPPAWQVHTTAGSTRALERQGLATLRDLVIAAGDFRATGDGSGSGGPALVARGQWRWTPQDLVRPAQAVLAEARALFPGASGSGARGRYTVFLAPWPTATLRVGHSLHEALLLTAGQAFDPAEPDALSFLTSQMMRNWVGDGGVLRRRGDSIFDTLWFRDGVPAYYGVLLPARAGQFPHERALDRLQEGVVNAYRREAIRDLRLHDLKRWYHWDERVARSSALKGALVALLLDVRLRSRQKSLDGWLAHLEGRLSGGRRYTASDLAREASAYAGEDLAAFFSERVVGVEPLPIESWLRDAGFAVASTRETFTDFGMAMRVEDGVLRLCDVRQGGAAHRAGLREADVVEDYYMMEGRFDLPAWVRVARSEQSTTIRFSPDRGERDLFRLSADGEPAKAILAGMLAPRH